MPNYDGMWELRFRYTTTPTGMPALEHRLTLDVRMNQAGDVGGEFSDFELRQKNGLFISLESYIILLSDVLGDVYNTTSEFGAVELWNYPATSTDATFYSVRTLGLAGTQAGNAQPAQQATMTFRSQNGGIARLQMMEAWFAGNAFEYAPFANPLWSILADFLVAPESPVVARDDGYLVAPLKLSHGQNEKLWRKRYRP